MSRSLISFIKRRKKRVFLYGLILSALTLYSFSRDPITTSWTVQPDDKRFVYTYPNRDWGPNRIEKRILLWTGFVNASLWDTDSDVLAECPNKCTATTDRSLLLDSDAVLFNARDLSEHFELPPSRLTHQVWVLHNTEPPYYIYLDTSKLNYVFNWTSWYRKDATIFSPYGEWVPLSKEEKSLYKAKNYWQNKTKMALWVASNCNDKAKRKTIVKELRKYIDVDTYGKCGQHNCTKNCFGTFSKYKFFLSFENGFCRDYITEKFWRPIVREQIPVVRGGANYEEMVPPRSYIDAMDISVKSLAEKLIRIGSDRELYNSYFEWKSKFKLKTKGHGWTRMNWCKFCEKLHDTTQPAQVYYDFRGWLEQDVCFQENWNFNLYNIIHL